MYDILGTVVFMSLVFGLAAGILWLLDRFSLRRAMNEEKKTEILKRRGARLFKFWWMLFTVMAVISLPLNWYGLLTKKEPLFPAIIWIAVATLCLLGLLSQARDRDKK